jgi:hypothetical protein
MTFPPMSLPASRKFYGSPPPTEFSWPLAWVGCFFLPTVVGPSKKWTDHPTLERWVGWPERPLFQTAVLDLFERKASEATGAPLACLKVWTSTKCKCRSSQLRGIICIPHGFRSLLQALLTWSRQSRVWALKGLDEIARLSRT